MTATLNQALIGLEGARTTAHRDAAEGLDRVFATAFASRDADIAAYADWFFEWGRSWRLLYEALTGAVEETLRLSFSTTQVTDAARQAVESYLLRHYQDFVLKPEIRDPGIAGGARAVLIDARAAYLDAVARLDDDLQRFLAEKTSFVEELPADAVAVKIDWDAARWRAPTGALEDRTLEPVASAAVIGSGAMLGSILQRVALPFFARATAQVMATAEMAVGGAAAGSFQPGIGTALGALAGVAIDWGLSEYREYMERDDFVRDNDAALDATIAAWKDRIRPEVDRSIDVWFDDARATLGSMAPR